MDTRERNFIRDNLSQLLQTISYSSELAAHLQENGSFGTGEVSILEVRFAKTGNFGTVFRLLDLLMTRGGGFNALRCALKLTNQSDAVRILESFEKQGEAVTSSGRVNNQNTSLDDVNDPGLQEALDFIISKRKLDVKVERLDATRYKWMDSMVLDKHRLLDISVKLLPLAISDSHVLPNGDRGLALILNIIEFQHYSSWSRRNGSDIDVDCLTKLLIQLDYEVHPTDKTLREKGSKTSQEMLQFIKDFKDRCNEIKPKSIIVFIGTHGFHPLQLATSDTEGIPPPPTKKLDVFEDIVAKFSHDECPGMDGKPKIFLIQACQEFLPRTEYDSMARRYIKNAIIYTAGMPGETVKRDIYKGSWFVYCFTYMMMKHAKDMSFQDVMEGVKNMMKMIRSEAYSEHVLMPISFMSKQLYFLLNPKKEN